MMLLATLPQAIGSCVATAAGSGLLGTGKELFASGQAPRWRGSRTTPATR